MPLSLREPVLQRSRSTLNKSSAEPLRLSEADISEQSLCSEISAFPILK